jgi:hypothetical protein
MPNLQALEANRQVRLLLTTLLFAMAICYLGIRLALSAVRYLVAICHRLCVICRFPSLPYSSLSPTHPFWFSENNSQPLQTDTRPARSH